MELLGAYGRALADVGKHEQALEVLNRAHTPDRPDWRILSVQGAVLDQIGRHEDAQRYYATALRIVPDEPSVLSNLGLSYALAKNLPEAESDAAARGRAARADPRVRQNLALVVGLQGRFAEAEAIARADLPPEQAAANVAYLRQMLAQQKAAQAQSQPKRGGIGGPADGVGGSPAKLTSSSARTCAISYAHASSFCQRDILLSEAVPIFAPSPHRREGAERADRRIGVHVAPLIERGPVRPSTPARRIADALRRPWPASARGVEPIRRTLASRRSTRRMLSAEPCTLGAISMSVGGAGPRASCASRRVPLRSGREARRLPISSIPGASCYGGNASRTHGPALPWQ